MVSKKLVNAVKLSEKRGYVIAQEAGLHPSMLSQIINNYIAVRDNDARVVAIGKVVGVAPSDCFEAN
jgi:hypothetical protein